MVTYNHVLGPDSLDIYINYKYANINEFLFIKDLRIVAREDKHKLIPYFITFQKWG